MVVSRGEPLARILPIPQSISDRERELVAAGILKLPRKRVKNWKRFVDKFLATSEPNPSRERRLQEKLIKTVVEEREEGW